MCRRLRLPPALCDPGPRRRRLRAARHRLQERHVHQRPQAQRPDPPRLRRRNPHVRVAAGVRHQGRPRRRRRRPPDHALRESLLVPSLPRPRAEPGDFPTLRLRLAIAPRGDSGLFETPKGEAWRRTSPGRARQGCKKKSQERKPLALGRRGKKDGGGSHRSTPGEIPHESAPDAVGRAALGVLTGVAYVRQAAEPAGAKMAVAAEKFLAGLTPEQTDQTALAFDGPERMTWTIVPLAGQAAQPDPQGREDPGHDPRAAGQGVEPVAVRHQRRRLRQGDGDHEPGGHPRANWRRAAAWSATRSGTSSPSSARRRTPASGAGGSRATTCR